MSKLDDLLTNGDTVNPIFDAPWSENDDNYPSFKSKIKTLMLAIHSEARDGAATDTEEIELFEKLVDEL